MGVPDGEARLYSLTLNPIVHLNPHGNFDAYIIGGGGYYHRTVEFTQPTVNTIVAFDPFFGFFPLDVPANQVVGSYSQNKGGLNIGAGASFRVKADSNAKFFNFSSIVRYLKRVFGGFGSSIIFSSASERKICLSKMA